MTHLKFFLWIKEKKVSLIIFGLSIAFFIPFMFFTKPVRVGDGSEYYALSLAWKTTLQPFMTDASWVEYDHLVESSQIIGLSSVMDLKKTFSPLALGDSSDFLHFWFYSLCAALVTGIGSVFGINIPIHVSFLAVHYILFTCMLVISWKGFGWNGVVAASILTFLSPIIWHVDKVHTEFFTYCLTTSAIILFLRRHYVASALFLALASTQNISFIAISFFVLGFAFLSCGKKKYSLNEVILLVLAIIILALHPVYYFFRLGKIDPILLTGSARVGSNIQHIFIWFFDPDLGLLPNWPFGIVLLIFSLSSLHNYKLRKLDNYRWLFFISFYITVSLIAQSSTTNLHSGATPGLARYGLWYLGLFFPAVLLLVNKLANFKKFTTPIIIFLIFGLFFSIIFFRPNLPEGHTKPSPASYWLQKHSPNLYNPPPEIFAERYGGIGEAKKLWETFAIVGPDCKKILLINRLPDNEYRILGGEGCGFDKEKLLQLIKQHLVDGSLEENGAPIYMRLSSTELEESRFIPISGKWYLANSESNITNFMSDGWSTPENWGTWSDSGAATLVLPCFIEESQLETLSEIEMEISPFVAPPRANTKISIYIQNNKVWERSLSQSSIIQIQVPDKACAQNNNFSLVFIIDNPTSPLSLSLSSDSRALGVALQKIRFIAPSIQ